MDRTPHRHRRGLALPRIFRPLAPVAIACAIASSAPASAPAPPPAAADPAPPEAKWPAKTHYRTVVVKGRRIFYREAGEQNRPTILLLHGFPSSSHTYRELIPLLSGRYRVVAPDYLGSGFSDHPKTTEVDYTFDLIAEHVTGFIEAVGLDRYYLYIQDFGAPVGFRVAIAHPERLLGLIVQNGNAYLDGLTEERRAFFRRARDDKSAGAVAALRERISDKSIIEKQYLRDVPGEKAARMSPDAWTHDLARMPTPEDREIQVRLYQDYQNNIDTYPAWQAFLRDRKPPTLIVWGRHDPAFIAAGAQAYLRDLPDAQLHLIDAGHFAAEEAPVPIAQRIVGFIEGLEGKK